MDSEGKTDLRELTAEIVTAYVSKNQVQRADLPSLITSVHEGLSNLDKPPVQEVERLTPPVSVRKSIGDDYLISMEDGRRYKSLKRHLAGRGLTPAEYRSKWSLPIDYPMVAPSYARQRSQLAKTMGLGRKREAPPAPAPKAKRQKAPKPAEMASE